MGDLEALMAAIIAHPTEDTPRLMLADYFEENGEPARAAFIRANVAAETELDHFKRAEEHAKTDLTQLPPAHNVPAGVALESHRGFWDGASVTAAFFLSDQFDALRARFPLTHVRIIDEVNTTNAAAIVEKLDRLEIDNVTFDLIGGERGSAVTALLNTSHADHLRELTIGPESTFWHDPARMSAFENAASASHLKNLRHLDLNGAILGASESTTLSFHRALPYLTSLRSLNLSGNLLGSEIAPACMPLDELLAPLEHLVSLSLHYNGLTPAELAGVNRLAGAKKETLRSIDVGDNYLLTEAALITAVHSHPHLSDANLRLVGYEALQVQSRVTKDPKNDDVHLEQADVLERHGNPGHADFIRRRVRAHQKYDHIDRREMHEEALRHDYKPDFPNDVPHDVHLENRRGFHDVAQVNAEFLLGPGFEALCRRFPITDVSVSGITLENAAAVAERLDTMGIDHLKVNGLPEVPDVSAQVRAQVIRSLLLTHHSEHLTELDMSGLYLGEQNLGEWPHSYMEAFAASAPYLKNLHHLDFSSNLVGNSLEGQKLFARATESMTELRSLNLNNNSFGWQIVHGPVDFVTLLGNLKNLRSLELQGNGLNDIELPSLNELVGRLEHFRSLAMNDNSISYGEARHALAPHPHLINEKIRMVGWEREQFEARLIARGEPSPSDERPGYDGDKPAPAADSSTSIGGGRDPDEERPEHPQKWRDMVRDNERFDGMKPMREPSWPKRF